MGHKYGEAFVHEKIDRGFRELGGFFFEGSNIAQPQYQLRGTYGPPRELEGPETSEKERVEEPHPVEISRDDPGKEDRGMDRE
jgi:hypothetical protein